MTGVSSIVVSETEVRMNFTGDWDEIFSIEYASWAIRCKAALVDPAMYAIDVASERQTSTKGLIEALEKTPGVQKVFMEAGRLFIFSRVTDTDPRVFQQVVKDSGFRWIALRSHRLRTLSYDAWEANSSPEALKQLLLKTPGVLRVDLDPKEKTISVLLIRESTKDPGLVLAAEEAGFSLYPGKAADDDDEPTLPAGGTEKK